MLCYDSDMESNVNEEGWSERVPDGAHLLNYISAPGTCVHVYFDSILKLKIVSDFEDNVVEN